MSLPLSGFLSTYYGIQVEEKLWFDSKEAYRDGNYFYFITSIDNREIIFMEQASLSYYLMDYEVKHVTLPIPNLQGEWITPFHDKNYLVMRVSELNHDRYTSDGIALANFHHIGSNYQYQPKEISSYGAWKTLWINKLTIFETKIKDEAKNNPCDYYKLLMDLLPYLVGISENAIQYIRETETENRFHEVDQGSITFNRYKNQLIQPILWSEDLVYDHPTRDIAEYIRSFMLVEDDGNDISTFLQDYQYIRPLSIFSLRLIYARLLFPIHWFDLINRGFMEENLDQLYLDLRELADKQVTYERALKEFFEINGVRTEDLDIPVINWL
ncbi:hypothetical protein [Oceanobacillus senegalensis]|uniref:hypothetical protein n=1 Tax=Oceanobacillus senegalensis TaxID=1936063 RepID=UPI000A3126A2|nr:hypothetical protein [Oceanobacillus senegalensis]